MKKVVSLVLLLVLCLSLCACGSKSPEDVKEDLVEGYWQRQIEVVSEGSNFGQPISIRTKDTRTFTFSYSGSFTWTRSTYKNNEQTGTISLSGTYTILEEKIILSYEGDLDEYLYYKYENGELVLEAEEDGTRVEYIHEFGL